MKSLLPNETKSFFNTLFLLQILIFFIIFGPFDFFNLDLTVYKNKGDGPSYLNFSFENINSILSDHRTFGLPLILKMYMLFDQDLTYWSIFNYILFAFSINFFLYSLIRAGFNSLFSFIWCFSLLISYNLFLYFSYWTEILSIIFCLFSLSSFLLITIDQNEIKFKFVLFTFLIFYMYQVRPSFIIFIFFPIIYSIISNRTLNTKYNVKFISLMCLIPLFLFLFLRFVAVGNFGLVSFNGGPAANAIIYLEHTDIDNLQPENQIFAKKILEKKRKIPFPCNLEKETDRVAEFNTDLYGQKTCWNEYFMLAWMQAIEENKGLTPFPKNDPRNIDAWNHVESLAIFFNEAGSNVGPDKILSAFAKDVYLQNKLFIVQRLLKSPYDFLRYYRDAYKNQFLIFYIIIIFLIIFYRSKNVSDSNQKFIDKELVITLTGFIIWILNMLLFYGHQNGELRALTIQNFFIIPFFFSYFTYLIVIKLRKNIN